MLRFLYPLLYLVPRGFNKSRLPPPVGPLTAVCLNAQNAGNRISELLDFKCLFGGACPQTPLGERGRKAPLVVAAAYYTFSGRL